MRLAVLDTNVIVSAAVHRAGSPGQVVWDALEDRIRLVTCPTILAEYREVVRRPKLVRRGLPPDWLDFLVGQSLHLPDPPPWPVSGPDPDDLIFLALAKSAGAVLVTGNLADYPAAIRKGVKVLAPAQYLERLRADAPFPD